MRTHRNDAKWEGLCHGWAPASLYYRQPNPTELKNKDGIAVSFGSSDVKALLTYFMAEYNEQQTSVLIADRCEYDLEENPSYSNSSACADINAGTYHVILVNQIGASKQGFVVDRDRSIQVWNQPVFQYSSQVLGTRSPSTGSMSGTVRELEISTSMTYSKETRPAWDAHPPYPVTEKYDYWVELDARGNIIGGSHNTWDRPDFQWYSNKGPFYGYFSGLETVYQASINNSVKRSIDFPTLKPAKLHVDSTAPTGTIGLSSYGEHHRQSWTIAPKNATSILIQFKSFNTERHRDKLKIFEGLRGEGALVAVLHGEGEVIPDSVVVNSSTAYLLFVSDNQNMSGGFQATYKGQ